MRAFQDFSDNPELLLSPIAATLGNHGSDLALAVLQEARPSLEVTGYDNWNQGTALWTLNLEVPLELYARIEPGIEQLEGQILERCQTSLRPYSNDRLTAVYIQPIPDASSAWRGKGRPLAKVATTDKLKEIWGDLPFRLFLSPTSKHKAEVSHLKLRLSGFGISCFVAHVDIEPDEEWQNDILIALNTADAVAALLTPDFHESNWTDQETGIALGKGIPVISVKLGSDPYGFLNKRQAVVGELDHIEALSSKLVKALFRASDAKVREALVNAVEQASSFDRAKSAFDMLAAYDGYSRSQLKRLLEAPDNNIQVEGARGGKLGTEVREFVYRRAPELVEPPQETTPFVEEYDPFADD